MGMETARTKNAQSNMIAITPLILLICIRSVDKAISLEPDRKYPNNKNAEIKLIIFWTYLTSPYSLGGRKRVFTIEQSIPNTIPQRVDMYRTTTCLLCFETTIKCRYQNHSLSSLRYRCAIVPSVDKKSIVATKIIRFGPAGLTGTVALFRVVKTGVLS